MNERDKRALRKELNRQIDLAAIVERDTTLKRVANTKGGEYTGPCPLCGGGTDRFHLWPEHPSGYAQFWCRKCGHAGGATWYLKQRDGSSLREIAERYGHGARHLIDRQHAGNARRLKPAPQRTRVSPPGPDWQTAASTLSAEAQANLWSDKGKKALNWLRERGLSDDTIKRWKLGFWPAAGKLDGRWIARGITIPWTDLDGTLWKVNVRRARGKSKYRAMGGSSNAGLYGVTQLTGAKPVLVLEGEFDAMLAAQELGDLYDVLTLGPDTGRLADRWLAVLMPVKQFLICTDNDEAGERAASYWLDLVGKRGVRVLPPGGEKDLTDSWRAGCNLYAWAQTILHRQNKCRSTPAPPDLDGFHARAAELCAAIVAHAEQDAEGTVLGVDDADRRAAIVAEAQEWLTWLWSSETGALDRLLHAMWQIKGGER